jgi:endonuclease-3
MAAQNRSSRLSKLHKVLKKHYKPVLPDERPVLDQMLFACCLENARYDAAQRAYTALAEGFFDWNEVRVSTVKELADVMKALPDPEGAATNLRNVLQHTFESTYSFDLEDLKKLKLGQATAKLEKIAPESPFVRGWVIQTSLGGHSIPLDAGALEVLFIVGIATEKEVASGQVGGMERAISKRQGQEFGSLLHHLAVELVANRMSPAVHKLLLEIAPDAKERLPKRRSKTPPPSSAADGKQGAKGKGKLPAKVDTKADAKSAAKKGAEKKAPAKPDRTAAAKPKAPPRGKVAAKKTAARKKSASMAITRRKPK